MQEKHPPEPGISRREFVTTAAAAAAGLMIVPRHVLGRGFQAPSDLVNVAAVGINGQGGINTRAVMSQNIVAICDCDTTLLDGRLQAWKTTADRMAVPAGQDPNAGIGRPRAGRWPRRRPGRGRPSRGTAAVAMARIRDVEGARLLPTRAGPPWTRTRRCSGLPTSNCRV